MIEKIEKLGEKWWGTLILISLPVFAVLSPVLVGGNNFFLSEAENFQAGFYFYKYAILSGDSIFWNPYVSSGFPSFASITGGFLNPFVYVAMKFLSVPTAYNLFSFFYFTLAGLFTTLFLKKLKIGFWGSYIGGIIFTFSQWTHSHDITINCTFFLLPLLCYLLMEARSGGAGKRAFIILLGAGAVGIVWLSAHWHFLIEVFFVVGLFSLFLSFLDFKRDKKELKERFPALVKEHFREYVKAPVIYFLMVFIGTLIGLIQLMPTIVFLNLSIRAQQFTHLDAIREGGVHLYDLIGFFLPYFNYPFLTRSSFFIDYVGVLPLFLVPLAIVFTKKKGVCAKFSPVFEYLLFFSFSLVFFLALSANYSPIFYIFHFLPVMNLLHDPSRWMLIVSFCAAILSGFGLELIAEKFDETRQSRRTKIMAKVFGWATALLAVVSFAVLAVSFFLKERILFLLNDYFDRSIYPKTSGLPLEYYHSYIARLLNDLFRGLDLLGVHFFVPFIFLVGGYFLVRLYIQGRFKPKQFIALTSLIIVLNFVLVYIFDDKTGPMRVLNKEPDTVKFLQSRPEGKVFSFLRYVALAKLGDYMNSTEKSVLKSALIFPNSNFRFGIESVDFEGGPLANKSMVRLTSYIGAESSVPGEETIESMKSSPEEKSKIFDSRKPVVDFLGVRYLLSAGPVNEKIFPKIFETAVTSKKILVDVYENKEARPLYYFTDEDWLAGLNKKITAEELGRRLKNSDGKITQDGIRLLEKKNGFLALETDVSKERIMVFSQNNLPGWRAYIDGKETPIYDIGTVFMGVAVPAGAHRVSFDYSYWDIWRYFFKNNL